MMLPPLPTIKPLTVLAMSTVTCMLVAWSLKPHNRGFSIVFAVAWALGATNLFVEGAWLIGTVQAVLSVVATHRFLRTFR
jgi:hypothetical protein